MVYRLGLLLTKGYVQIITVFLYNRDNYTNLLTDYEISTKLDHNIHYIIYTTKKVKELIRILGCYCFFMKL